MLSRIWIQRKASSDQFPRVLLFPEGTTTNGRVIISFQLGAFIPGYPIQPVIVRYPHVHFDQSWLVGFLLILISSFPHMFTFLVLMFHFVGFDILFRGNISLAMLMFRMFTQFHNFMEVLSPSLSVSLLFACVLTLFVHLEWLSTFEN